MSEHIFDQASAEDVVLASSNVLYFSIVYLLCVLSLQN